MNYITSNIANLKICFAFICFLTFAPLHPFAQKVGSNAKPYFVSFDTQNDFFIARKPTNRYFLNSINVDFWQHESRLKGSKLAFLPKIFPNMEGGENYIGIGFNMNSFTPSRFYNTIPLGDRPFAGWSNVYVSNITFRQQDGLKFTTSYSLGFLGKLAGQSWLQERWHKASGQPFPSGWDYQIANDIALNINFLGEKSIYNIASNFDCIGFIEVNTGTVANFMGVGTMLRLGKFDDYFSRPTFANGVSAIQTFAYFKPHASVVLDNSLLQGGYFNRSSSHKILQDELQRFYFQIEFGYSLTINNFNIKFFQQFRTPEFEGAANMLWGGFNLVYAF